MSYHGFGKTPSLPSKEEYEKMGINPIPVRADGTSYTGSDEWKIAEYFYKEGFNHLSQSTGVLYAQHDGLSRLIVGAAIGTTVAVIAGMYFVEKYWGRHG